MSGALAVLMKDAIKPTLMQTLEVRRRLEKIRAISLRAAEKGGEINLSLPGLFSVIAV